MDFSKYNFYLCFNSNVPGAFAMSESWVNANKEDWTSDYTKHFALSLTYIRNNSRPRTLSCGTPMLLLIHFRVHYYILHNKCSLLTY